MSEKGLKVLLVALVTLVLLWVGVTFLPRGSGGAPEASGAIVGFFDGATPEAVTAVRFTGPGDTEAVELTRSGGVWRVNGFKADSASVARFWEDVGDAEVGNVAAANPSNHARMGVAADSTWRMELELSGGTRTLLVGNPGSRYGTTFVRLPQADEVYLLEGNLRPHVTRTLEAWRSKAMARVDTSAVRRVEVEREGDRWSLERSDSLWVLNDGGETQPSAVRSLLGELARLDASGFHAPGDSLPAHGGSVIALGQAGDTLFAVELGSGEGDRWARVPGDSIVYKVPAYRVSRLLPERETVEGGG